MLMSFDLSFLFLFYFRSELNDFQISRPQYLEESRLYYVEVLFKQGVGFSRMYVAMRTPSGEMIMPINSTHLVKQLTEYGECY